MFSLYKTVGAAHLELFSIHDVQQHYLFQIQGVDDLYTPACTHAYMH